MWSVEFDNRSLLTYHVIVLNSHVICVPRDTRDIIQIVVVVIVVIVVVNICVEVRNCIEAQNYRGKQVVGVESIFA